MAVANVAEKSRQILEGIDRAVARRQDRLAHRLTLAKWNHAGEARRIVRARPGAEPARKAWSSPPKGVRARLGEAFHDFARRRSRRSPFVAADVRRRRDGSRQAP